MSPDLTSTTGDETPAACVERLSLRKLTLQTSLSDHLSKCNQQSQSPLFTKIPKEIRDMILECCTAQHEDLARAYPRNAFHYRPGYRGPHKTYTSLLRTCRRIWLEANALPMRQNVLSYWFEACRGPVAKPQYDIDVNWTKLNRENFTTLQFFTQRHELVWLFQRPGPARKLMERLQPKVLRITIRHTDWNRWEDPLPLALESRWLQEALDASYLSNLHSLHIELETLVKYIDQVDPIVERLSQLSGKPRALSNGNHCQLKPCPDDTYTWHWTGPPNIDNTIQPAHKDLGELNYHVTVLTWKAYPCPANAQGTTSSEVTFSTPRIMFHSRHMARRRPPTMSEHALRLQLLQGGWDSYQFPFKHHRVQKVDGDNAGKTGDMMRDIFRRMFADIEVKRFEDKWREDGSLLKFED